MWDNARIGHCGTEAGWPEKGGTGSRPQPVGLTLRLLCGKGDPSLPTSDEGLRNLWNTVGPRERAPPTTSANYGRQIGVGPTVHDLQ